MSESPVLFVVALLAGAAVGKFAWDAWWAFEERKARARDGFSADLVTVSPEKVALLVLRPTRPQRAEWYDRLSVQLRQLREGGALPPNVVAVVIPEGVDVIVVGEADLQRGVSVSLAERP